MPGHRKRRQFKQTDAFTRGMVIGLKRAGWSIRQIAADTHLGASTVHRLWRRWLEQGNVAIYRNVGATRVTSACVDRRILRQAVAAPQATCTAILQHVKDTLDHSISTRTISRRLVANGLHSCRPLRRLPLTPPNRRQRLEWCRARSTWMTEWHRVVFSDESRFCLSSDSRRVRVWRRRGERSNPAAIVERPTVRQRGIMVWGAIAYDSRSPLLRIQGTMTAQRYVDDVLRSVTLPYLQGVPNALYQQDNARPHTARISQQALQDVQMLPWPPYSPDLSPIELVWDIIGRRLHALPQPRSEDELWQMVEREWRAIPQDAIRTLIDSLPRRVAACIAIPDDFPGYSPQHVVVPPMYQDSLECVLIPRGLVMDRDKKGEDIIDSSIDELYASLADTIKSLKLYKVEKLAQDIIQDLDGKSLVALCVLKGGYRFFSDLLGHMPGVQVFPEFIRLKSYQDDKSTGQVQVMEQDVLSQLEDKNVVVVEDLVDTGRSLSTLLELLPQYGPRSVSLASLLLKRTPGATLKPRYCGFEVPNKFIVGYAIDYNEHFRNIQNASAFVIKTGSTTQWQADLAPKEMAASDMRNRHHVQSLLTWSTNTAQPFEAVPKMEADTFAADSNMSTDTAPTYPWSGTLAEVHQPVAPNLESTKGCCISRVLTGKIYSGICRDQELMLGRRRTKLRSVTQANASCCFKRSDCCLPPTPVYFMEDSRRFYELLSPILLLFSFPALQLLATAFTVSAPHVYTCEKQFDFCTCFAQMCQSPIWLLTFAGGVGLLQESETIGAFFFIRSGRKPMV
ncbi:HPRT1 [Cordylochernes scorpioides]|uniref:HPRT1 n=1 Tax=Cordylochernes scorpioides TaxID=51811 RepID=A0ABY6L861_9ARAC|nr:HPRT1 [Cordylochernes scorpioides]